MYETINHKDASQYLFGIPTQHSPLAVWMLEQILNRYRPGAIVEIGTFMGGLTTYLGIWALHHSARMLSVDIKPKAKYETEMLLHDIGIYCEEADALEPGFVRFVQSFIQHDGLPILIYCDGGHKLKELQIYGDVVPPGSLIGCHDYGTEVHPATAETIMNKKGFTRLVTPETLRELNTLQQFWIRKGRNESKPTDSDVQAGSPA